MYFHNPIEFRLIKYRAPTLDRSIMDIQRKAPTPSAHKVLPAVEEIGTQSPLGKKAPPDEEKIREQYRSEHDQLERLELHHPYQEIRNQWNLRQVSKEIRPLHIGFVHEAKPTDTLVNQTARFFGDQYHSELSQLDIANRESPLSYILEKIQTGLLTLIVIANSHSELVHDLICQSPCPVLIVGDQAVTQLKRILVPCDGTPFSYPALAQGIVCCEDFGSELHVLHVTTDAQQQRVEHKQMSHLMNQLAWHEIQHDTVTVSGDVTERLAEYCQSSMIDLVMMGTHRQNERTKSSTLEFVDKMPCPIWVLYPN